MQPNDCRVKLIAAATPLFASRGLHGVNIREIAGAAGVNSSMISYYLGGKNGLYAAVVEEQFASLYSIAQVAEMAIDPWDKFARYIYQCGICFHEGTAGEFTPFTASSDRGVLECPRCLNNDAGSFVEIGAETPQVFQNDRVLEAVNG